MSHVIEHCKFPLLWFRKRGSVWVCTCGKAYFVSIVGAQAGNMKCWEAMK